MSILAGLYGFKQGDYFAGFAGSVEAGLSHLGHVRNALQTMRDINVLDLQIYNHTVYFDDGTVVYVERCFNRYTAEVNYQKKATVKENIFDGFFVIFIKTESGYRAYAITIDSNLNVKSRNVSNSFYDRVYIDGTVPFYCKETTMNVSGKQKNILLLGSPFEIVGFGQYLKFKYSEDPLEGGSSVYSYRLYAVDVSNGMFVKLYNFYTPAGETVKPKSTGIEYGYFQSYLDVNSDNDYIYIASKTNLSSVYELFCLRIIYSNNGVLGVENKNSFSIEPKSTSVFDQYNPNHTVTVYAVRPTLTGDGFAWSVNVDQYSSYLGVFRRYSVVKINIIDGTSTTVSVGDWQETPCGTDEYHTSPPNSASNSFLSFFIRKDVVSYALDYLFEKYEYTKTIPFYVDGFGYLDPHFVYKKSCISNSDGNTLFSLSYACDKVVGSGNILYSISDSFCQPLPFPRVYGSQKPFLQILPYYWNDEGKITESSYYNGPSGLIKLCDDYVSDPSSLETITENEAYEYINVGTLGCILNCEMNDGKIIQGVSNITYSNSSPNVKKTWLYVNGIDVTSAVLSAVSDNSSGVIIGGMYIPTGLNSVFKIDI